MHEEVHRHAAEDARGEESGERVSEKEIARRILRVAGIALMYVAAYHLGGWWAFALVAGWLFAR